MDEYNTHHRFPHPLPGQVQEAAAGGLGEGHLGLQGRDAEADPQGGAERFGAFRAVGRGSGSTGIRGRFKVDLEKNTWTEMFFLMFFWDLRFFFCENNKLRCWKKMEVRVHTDVIMPNERTNWTMVEVKPPQLFHNLRI